MMTPRFRAYLAPARPRAQIWRGVVGLGVVVLVYVILLGAAGGIYAARYGVWETETLMASLAVSSTPRTLLIVLASFAPIILGLMLVCPLLHKRPFGSLIGPAPRALRDFGRAVVVFGGIYALGLALYLVAAGSQANVPLGLWVTLLPLTLLGILVQTGAEELLFRGYLQQQLAARFASPVIWAVLPALLFGMLHFDPARLGETAPYAVAAATVFGLIAADLTVRSGSLGAAWGAHFTNNLFAMALLSVDGTLTGLALRVTHERIEELALSPWLMLGDLLPMGLAWWLLRRWIVLR